MVLLLVCASVHNGTVHTAHSKMNTVHCTMKTAHFTLQTAQSTLNTAHCTAIIAHFTFSGVQNAFCFAVSCEGGGKRDVSSTAARGRGRSTAQHSTAQHPGSSQRQESPSVIGGSLVFGTLQCS